MTSRRLWILPVAIVFGAPGAAWLAFMLFGQEPQVTFQAPVIASGSSAPANQQPANQQPVTNPKSVKIDVPFMSQAPFAVWDDLHQEACEEMSLLLVIHYLEGTPLSPETAERELQDLVAWQTANGYAYDVSARELADIAEAKYGLNARVIENVTIEDIKREIAQGNPVIVPAAGQRLGNPYFSGDGPPYHMLVVIGYDSDEFITNDVGTKRGAGFRYPQQRFYDAIHDWTGSKETIEEGAKNVIVVTK